MSFHRTRRHVSMLQPTALKPSAAIANCLVTILFISLAVPGPLAAARQLWAAIRSYQSDNRPIPIAVERAAAYVRSQIPASSPVLLVVSTPDAWIDGLWQRALYPNPIFLVFKQDL